MSSISSSIINMIAQHITQYTSQINNLKSENNKLVRQNQLLRNQLNKKKYSDDKFNQLKAEFDSLMFRHNDIKTSYIETEQENSHLRKQMAQFQNENNLLIKNMEEYFKSLVNSTPPNHTCEINQKNQFLNVKHSDYDSETDSDDSENESKINSKFNFSNSVDTTQQSTSYNPDILTLNIDHSKEESDDDMTFEVMKKLIGEDLMNQIENNINSPSSKHIPIINKKLTDAPTTPIRISMNSIPTNESVNKIQNNTNDMQLINSLFSTLINPKHKK
jgi:hypothetical protein